MQRVTELLSQFSAWAVSLTAIIALISTVCKPLRSAIAKIVKRMSNDRSKNEELMKEIRNELKAIKNDLSQKIDDVCGRCQILSAKIDCVEASNDQNAKDDIRRDVLDFANSCHNGRKHTIEEFRNIISMNEKYIKLLEKTNDTNGVFTSEFAYIMSLYNDPEQTMIIKKETQL